MTIIVLSWPPCSWKTTYLKFFSDYKIISSDEEIDLLDKNKYSQNELNILWIKKSFLKINEFIKKWEYKIIYDSTNLTLLRRKNLLEFNQNIEIISFISDFNIIYENWINRWKDIKEEMLLYLFIIYKIPEKSEGFNNVKKIKNIEKNNFKYLKEFLEWKTFKKDKILNENKELIILDDFWKKWWKDFFDEFSIKLDYLEEMNLDDKLVLFYSDIKYFYNDFINILDLTYKVSYNDFIKWFIENILLYKINWLWLNKKNVLNSFSIYLKYF